MDAPSERPPHDAVEFSLPIQVVALDPAGDVNNLINNHIKLRVSSQRLSLNSRRFAGIFGNDAVCNSCQRPEMREEVGLAGQQMSKTHPPTIELERGDKTWTLMRLCKLSHGETIVDGELPKGSKSEKCEQYAEEVLELNLTAKRYQFRGDVISQLYKMARHRFRVYVNQRRSIDGLFKFVSVAHALNDALLFRDATSGMVQLTAPESIPNVFPTIRGDLVPFEQCARLWDMIRAGRERRSQVVFQKVRQALNKLNTSDYCFEFRHTIKSIANAPEPSEDFRKTDDFKDQDMSAMIDLCERRLSLQAALIALGRDIHGHLEYLGMIAKAESNDPVKFELPDIGHKSRSWARFLDLHSDLECIFDENRVGCRGWCLNCFKSDRQTELSPDDHWQCSHGCYLG